jgi:hypothetical protein
MKYAMQWELQRPEQRRITLNVMGKLRDKTEHYRLLFGVLV